MITKLEAPWQRFYKKVNALFALDPDIEVGPIVAAPNDDAGYNYALNITVKKHDKFLALDRVVPEIKEFGNVKLRIILYDVENEYRSDDIDLYKTIFSNNPIVKDIKDAKIPTGETVAYVRFQPDVVQFFDDDLSDYNGNWTGLAQDIASEFFDNDFRGVFFCTASKEQ